MDDELGADLEVVVGVHLGSSVVVGDESEPGLGEDVEPKVAAAFGPFVGLLGEHGADEADDRVTIGENAEGVGAAADLAVEALVGVVRPDLLPEPTGASQ